MKTTTKKRNSLWKASNEKTNKNDRHKTKRAQNEIYLMNHFFLSWFSVDRKMYICYRVSYEIIQTNGKWCCRLSGLLEVLRQNLYYTLCRMHRLFFFFSPVIVHREKTLKLISSSFGKWIWFRHVFSWKYYFFIKKSF